MSKIYKYNKNDYNINHFASYNSNTPITKIKIIGERCSGIHFVRFALTRNFHVEYEKGEGHFFGHEPLDIADDTLLICVVRNSVDWVDSFMKRLQHIPPMNKISINSFITNEFYSIYEEGAKIYQEIPTDRNYITGERYKNIFDLRYHKQKYFLEEVTQKVKNYLILPYELLRDHYIDTLSSIRDKFHLTQKIDTFLQIDQYKGTYAVSFTIKEIILPQKYTDIILSSINQEQESLLGYNNKTEQIL